MLRRHAFALVAALVASSGNSALAVSGLTLESGCVVAGDAVNATVEIPECRPAICPGDPPPVTVTLSSSSRHATVPASVVIVRRPGSPGTASFLVRTANVSIEQTATIRASCGSLSKTATLRIVPRSALFQSFSLDAAQVIGGSPTQLVFGLGCRAPAGGLEVEITNPRPELLSTPPRVTIPAGQSEFRLTAVTTPVPARVIVPLRATAAGRTFSRTLVILPGSINLTFPAGHGIEVTQGIQYFDDPAFKDNDVPLFSGRPTVVRAYLDTNTPIAIQHIEGRLLTRACGSGAAWRVYTPIDVTATAHPTFNLRRVREDTERRFTLDFLLSPDDVPLDGCLEMQVEINPANPEREIVETDYDDNVLRERFEFRPSYDLSVKFIRVDWCPGCPGDDNPRLLAPFDHVPRIAGYLAQVFPVSDVRYHYSSKDLKITRFEPSDFRKEGAWGWVLFKLAVRRGLSIGENPFIHYCALVHRDVPRDGIGGYAYLGSINCRDLLAVPRCTASRADRPDIVAQEIAHNVGRCHAPCGNPADLDPDWPSTSNPDAEIGHTGFRMDDLTPLPGSPAESRVDFDGDGDLDDDDIFFDFMSYCNDNWVSPYTYRRIYFSEIAFRTAGLGVAAGAADQTEDHLMIGGVIEHDGEVHLGSFYHRELPAGSRAERGEGPLSLRLVSGGGDVLFERRFNTFHSDHDGDEQEATGPFFQTIPYAPDTAHIELVRGGELLASRTVSASPPEVKVLTPGGDAHGPDEPIVVTWTASDADGDDLTFAVLFSADDGATWEALATEVRETSFELDSSRLAGSEKALVRVIASDGVHNGSDDSAPFAVASKAPEVVILAPTSGTVVTAGVSLLFRGTGSDPEDGGLPPEAFTWSSQLAGEIGTGDSVAATLEAGVHRIELEARDSDGQTSTDAIVVTVLEPDSKVEAGRVRPGDCNRDGVTDISDPICLLTFLFLDNDVELPCGDGTADDASNVLLLDSNGDTHIDISDPIHLLGWLFLGGPEPFLSTECVSIPGCEESCNAGDQ